MASEQLKIALEAAASQRARDLQKVRSCSCRTGGAVYKSRQTRSSAASCRRQLSTCVRRRLNFAMTRVEMSAPSVCPRLHFLTHRYKQTRQAIQHPRAQRLTACVWQLLSDSSLALMQRAEHSSLAERTETEAPSGELVLPPSQLERRVRLNNFSAMLFNSALACKMGLRWRRLSGPCLTIWNAGQRRPGRHA